MDLNAQKIFETINTLTSRHCIGKTYCSLVTISCVNVSTVQQHTNHQ